MLMITLAAVMLVRPEAMERVTGTFAVFATAAVLSAAAMAAQQLVTARHGAQSIQ